MIQKARYISEATFKRLRCTEIFEGDCLVSRLPDPVGRACILPDTGEKMITAVDCTIIRFDNKQIIPNWFLYYSLSNEYQNEIQKQVTGATRQRISRKNLGLVSVPVAPLPEQQRIVSILDKVFSVIERSRNNAEQNLKNAKKLFESYLQGVFEKKGDGWEEQLLEDCFKMKSGDNLTAKNMSEGEYPVFGGNGIAGYHNEFNLSGSNVIIGRVGALCGNVRHITENIWLTDNAFKVVDFKFDFDHSFLTYLLNHKDLRSYARQAAQPVISNSSLKDVVLIFPKSKKEQQTIVRQLDALRAETQKLEAVYQKKMDDLVEMKKSILQKAFAGELKTEKAAMI
ncbi:MAG: restriction endonuclease subunit S [Candidatus Kapaibacterium sp.]|nr:restriction endonuclease subunit S [Candidatus Kapabacteria bacterium]QOJ25872.1 MAG: restriction endonuclease subunit S [Ignavibacteria bacterium]WKZ77386.1 MAG: restriction endonuclease subunit S [Candidatus Kapabacteria bacterium]